MKFIFLLFLLLGCTPATIVKVRNEVFTVKLLSMKSTPEVRRSSSSGYNGTVISLAYSSSSRVSYYANVIRFQFEDGTNKEFYFETDLPCSKFQNKKIGRKYQIKQHWDYYSDGYRRTETNREEVFCDPQAH